MERKAVTSVLRKCVTCRRYQERPLLPPETPDLPVFRVYYMPFSAQDLTALDLCL